MTLLPTLLEGRPQRHLYRARPSAVLEAHHPAALYLEEECFSLVAMQWALAAHRAGVPYGLQAWENLDRPLPWVNKALRRRVLAHASFVVARTPAAQRQVEYWGARCPIRIIGSPVPALDAIARVPHEGFRVGFVGRLVEEKGVVGMVEASTATGATAVLIGDGPLASRLEHRPGVELHRGVAHEAVAELLATVDVLVLWSSTTATWAEQFGRVLVEAMGLGIPVVGSTCGEIPWVISTTGGGVVVPEGDHGALVAALTELEESPSLRTELGERGRRSVEATFSLDAAATAMCELFAGFGVTSGARGFSA